MYKTKGVPVFHAPPLYTQAVMYPFGYVAAFLCYSEKRRSEMSANIERR